MALLKQGPIVVESDQDRARSNLGSYKACGLIRPCGGEGWCLQIKDHVVVRHPSMSTRDKRPIEKVIDQHPTIPAQ